MGNRFFGAVIVFGELIENADLEKAKGSHNERTILRGRLGTKRQIQSKGQHREITYLS